MEGRLPFNDNTASLGSALFLYEASIYGPLDVSDGSSIVDSNCRGNVSEV